MTQHQDAFKAAVDWGRALFDHLEKEGTKNTWITSPLHKDGPWLLWLKLPEQIQHRFSLAQEVLLLAVPSNTGVEARDIDLAHREILEAGLRLDSDVLIVVDLRPNLADRLRRLSPWGQWIAWPPGSSGGAVSFPPLLDQIRRYLPDYDIFERRDPVRGHQVIGRRDSIHEIAVRAQKGQSVGVFGLRKVGKTTLVRAMTDTLDPLSASLSLPGRDDQGDPLPGEGEPRLLVTWLDCQSIVKRTRRAFAELVLRKLRERLHHAGLPMKDAADPDPESSLQALLERATGKPDLPPICVVLDEYDFLFESSDPQPAIRGIEQVFAVFRACAQQSGKLSLVVIGRDPEHFRRPRINGVTNPMLNWLTLHWVGPLDRPGADELLETLGRRVGLGVGSATRELAWRWTGGHPLLHRQYGSALLTVARKGKGGNESTPTDPLSEAALDPFLERDAVVDTCREIFDLLSTRYTSSAALLEELARESASQAAEVIQRHGGFAAPGAKMLRNFGLIAGDAGAPILPEVIRWYTRMYLPRTPGA
ncbi:MAG: hypothetical protein IT372_39605 [Polyangiaceae bacterium]|nr:hypothetical protein [Polyangiaceae bacterium]